MTKCLYWIFGAMSLVSSAGVVLAMLHAAGLGPSDGVTLFAGLLAAGIVWWQGLLISQQLQLQAVIELDKEWNSKEMLSSRSSAWNDQNQADKGRIEGVLEFLEKVSTLEKQGFISLDLVWETFGWYVWRYFYYSKDVIEELREDWTPMRRDPTLYEGLEAIWEKLVKLEVEKRNRRKRAGEQNLTEHDVIKELIETRKKFVSSEKGLSHD